MNSNVLSKRRNKRLLLLATIGIAIMLLLSTSIFISNNIQDEKFITSKTTKVYKNEQNKFSLEYPSSYEENKSSTYEEDMLFLGKDQIRGDNYILLKGTSVIVTYKKNIGEITGFVQDDVRPSFESNMDGKIEKTKVNSNEAVKATFGYNNPLKLPNVTKLYLTNKNDALIISFTVGDKVTEEEYEQYFSDFNFIANSVKFF